MRIYTLPKPVVANIRRNGKDYTCKHAVILAPDEEFAFSETKLAATGHAWSQSTWGKEPEVPKGLFVRTYPSPHVEWEPVKRDPLKPEDDDEPASDGRKRRPKVARHPKHGYLLVAKLTISSTPPQSQLTAGKEAPWLAAALKKAVSVDPQDCVGEDAR